MSNLPKATNRQLRDYDDTIKEARALLERNRINLVEDIEEKETELRALNALLSDLDRTLQRQLSVDPGSS